MVEVATAAIFRRTWHTEILLGRRSPDKPYAGLWECPGGKVEEGEKIGEALCRELYEELNVDSYTVHKKLCEVHFKIEGAPVVVHAFLVTLEQGIIRSDGSHDQIEWMSLDRMRTLPGTPAAPAIYHALRREFGRREAY